MCRGGCLAKSSRAVFRLTSHKSHNSWGVLLLVMCYTSDARVSVSVPHVSVRRSSVLPDSSVSEHNPSVSWYRPFVEQHSSNVANLPRLVRDAVLGAQDLRDDPPTICRTIIADVLQRERACSLLGDGFPEQRRHTVGSVSGTSWPTSGRGRGGWGWGWPEQLPTCPLPSV